MTREEYKVRLKAHLLFNDIVIPKWTKWLAIDIGLGGIRCLYVYDNKPMYHEHDSYRFWDVNDGRTNPFKICETNDIQIESKVSLLSIEELFDD